MSRQRGLRGLDPPPPPPAGGARLPLPDLPQLPGPGRAPARCSTGFRCGRRRRPAARLVPARATSWATRPCRSSRRCWTPWRSAPARRPDGPVRLLTSVRTFGHVFNPISLYYCFDRGGEEVRALVGGGDATRPGGSATPTPSTASRARVAKSFHVSPFLGMEADYRAAGHHARGPPPGARGEHHRRARQFDATLSLERRELWRRAALPLPAAVGARGGRDLRAGRPAQAEGRPLPPPSGAMIARDGAWRPCSGGSRPGGSRWWRASAGARSALADAPLRATITVRSPRFWAAFFRGSAGLARSYRDGEWACDDLVSLVRIGAREMPRLDRMRRPLEPAAQRPSPGWPATRASAREARGRPLRPGRRPVRAVPRRAR